MLAIGAPNEGLGGRAKVGLVTLVDGLDGSPASINLHQNTPGVPNANEVGDRFGRALLLTVVDGASVLAVGAPNEGIGGKPGVGAVWVFPDVVASATPAAAEFVHQGSAGVPGVNQAGDRFGATLAITHFGRLAVGSPGEDIGGHTDTGAVTVFFSSADAPTAGTASMFSQDSDGVPDDNEAGDGFGA
jgi:hypothetical protein